MHYFEMKNVGAKIHMQMRLWIAICDTFLRRLLGTSEKTG
jgi:hypothetical protein